MVFQTMLERCRFRVRTASFLVRPLARAVSWIASAGGIAHASAVDVHATTCGRSRVPDRRAAVVATNEAPRSTSNDGVGRSRRSAASDATRVPRR
jgi:hypothetical protein